MPSADNIFSLTESAINPATPTVHNMPLNFPNPMRYFEEKARGIQFWGYDRTIEIPFFVEESALAKLGNDAGADEEGYLRTFDIHRERIHMTAQNAYSLRKKESRVSSYTLAAADF